MPTKWSHSKALTGWLPFSKSGSQDGNNRVEPPVTRHDPADDVPLSVLEHFATPGEFMGERDAAAAEGKTERLAMLDASLTGVDLAKFAEPQPFRRIEVASGATLYRGPGARRRLLIAFGGRGNRMGPPTPVFLQCIDATRWDVLFMRDAHACHFRLGVAGTGKSFADVTRWLGPKAARYHHVTTIGYSSGGLPAIWAGHALGADRAICISAQRPSDVNRLFTASATPTAFDAACACLDGSVTRPFAFFHAAAHANDAGVAVSLAAQTGGVAVGAVGYNMHPLLGYMWMRGHLQGFFDMAMTTPLNANLQIRFNQHLRKPVAPYLSPRTDQIPAVAKGVAPDGN